MKDEKVLYETNVKYKKGKYDTKINITNNKITLLKKSGIFKRKYKIIEIINFNKINVYNDDVEVKRKHNIVEITTQEKIYKFECKTTNEAKRIVKDIISSMTGANKIKRVSNKISNIAKGVASCVMAVGGAAATIGSLVIIVDKNKKEIVKMSKTVMSLFKK